MIERARVTFDSAGTRCIGYLHRRANSDAVLPCVVMSNGFAGPQDTPSMMRYKPSRDAHRLAMPVLVCIAEHDREVPGEVGRQIAEAAPKGELKRYPVAHFDFYQAPLRTKIVEDQIAFLRRRLMKSEPST